MRAMRCLALLLVACASPPPATISDGCYEVGDALCGREAACGVLATSAGECRSHFVMLCCADVDCSRPVRSCNGGRATCCANAKCDVVAVDEDVFTRCESGVQALTCGQLAAGLTPSGCVNDGGS